MARRLQEDHAAAQAAAEEALTLAREAADSCLLARSLHLLAMVALKGHKDLDAACGLNEQSLALYRKIAFIILKSRSSHCKYMRGMSQSTPVPTIRFDATLYTVDQSTILRLPENASEKLPSRGQVAVEGTINGHSFQTVLEPDGSFGHWMKVDGKLQQAADVGPGETVKLEIEPVKEWPEPTVPQDLEKALAAAPQDIQDVWKEITAMARWEWVRWINATKNPDTRARRIEVSISKMANGKRRPCCFNLAGCTDPDLSKNGKLLEALS